MGGISGLNKSRLVVGLILVAVVLFVFFRGEYATPGSIAIGILGW